MKDNNQLIAQKIYDIENADHKQRKEWHKNNTTRWELTSEIYMEKSGDHMDCYSHFLKHMTTSNNKEINDDAVQN